MSFKNADDLKGFVNHSKTVSNEDFVTTIKQFERQDFRSLTPVCSEDEVESIREYKDYKLQSLRENFEFANARINEDEVELDDEDEMIANPYFASLLNRDREIKVDDDIYKYTSDGVYFTAENNIFYFI